MRLQQKCELFFYVWGDGDSTSLSFIVTVLAQFCSPSLVSSKDLWRLLMSTRLEYLMFLVVFTQSASNIRSGFYNFEGSVRGRKSIFFHMCIFCLHKIFFARRNGQSERIRNNSVSNDPSFWLVRRNWTIFVVILIRRISLNVVVFYVRRGFWLVRSWRNCKRSRCQTR